MQYTLVSGYRLRASGLSLVQCQSENRGSDVTAAGAVIECRPYSIGSLFERGLTT